METYYLTKLLPRRVDMDLAYLRDPTLAHTVRWLAITFLYLTRTAKPGSDTAEPESAGAATLVRPTDD